MKCTTPMELVMQDLLDAILADLPRLECTDFHHGMRDAHDGSDCPVKKRFDLAVKEAQKLIG